MTNPERADEVLDLSVPTDVHLIAIGGAGMAAIAELLHGMGHRVRGSDMVGSAAIDHPRSLGIDAIVPASGSAGNFEMMNRILDGAGIPVPASTRASVAAMVGLDA